MSTSTRVQVTVFDITLNGSIIGEAFGVEEARYKALWLSFEDFPGRLIRVHDVDGETVIFEARDGQPVTDAA